MSLIQRNILDGNNVRLAKNNELSCNCLKWHGETSNIYIFIKLMVHGQIQVTYRREQR